MHGVLQTLLADFDFSAGRRGSFAAAPVWRQQSPIYAHLSPLRVSAIEICAPPREVWVPAPLLRLAAPVAEVPAVAPVAPAAAPAAEAPARAVARTPGEHRLLGLEAARFKDRARKFAAFDKAQRELAEAPGSSHVLHAIDFDPANGGTFRCVNCLKQAKYPYDKSTGLVRSCPQRDYRVHHREVNRQNIQRGQSEAAREKQRDTAREKAARGISASGIGLRELGASSRSGLAAKQQASDARVVAHCKELNVRFEQHVIVSRAVDGRYRYFCGRTGCEAQSSNRKTFAREQCAAAAPAAAAPRARPPVGAPPAAAEPPRPTQRGASHAEGRE